MPGDLSPRGSPRGAGRCSLGSQRETALWPGPSAQSSDGRAGPAALPPRRGDCVWGGPPAQSSDRKAGPAALPPLGAEVSRTETCLEKRWAFTEPKPSQPISSAASRPGQALAEDTAPWASPLPEDGNAEQGGDTETAGPRQGSRPPADPPGSAGSGPGRPVSLQEAPLWTRRESR